MNTLKKFVLRFLVILLAVQGTIAAQLLTLDSAQAADGTPEVVLNEIMWMGSSAHETDEWIELRNTTADPIDLTGWKVTNVVGGSDLTIPSGTIAGHGLFLISHYDQLNASSALDVAPDYIDATLDIDDVCSAITLRDDADELVDEMGCEINSYFFPSDVSVKHALERNIVVADGTQAGSWHESTGFANIDITHIATHATPKIVNDSTPPSNAGAIVNDGSGEDIDFTVNALSLAANWDGFADLESGVESYTVGLGSTPGDDDVVAFNEVISKALVFTIPSWNEDDTYYVTVMATNGAGITSTPLSSDGVTLNTVDPETPTNLLVGDTLNDNGGSLTIDWSASVSPDVVSYLVKHRKQGTVDWSEVNTGMSLTTVLTGLENDPTVYEVTVEAIDFNGQHSLPTAIETGMARDNLAPVIDPTKVILSQNMPGTTDTLSGQVGASNEPGVTVYVFDRNPAEIGKVMINSVMANNDGSFGVLGVGDNQYGQVWLQLVDVAGNSSIASAFGNDIVAPNAPTLTKAVANCVGNPCRVTLEWDDNGPDTDHYRVSYTTAGVTKQTLDLSSANVVLDLNCGHYDFKVYAYDRYGNQSAESNTFSFRLTGGVKTTVLLIDGKQVVRTESIAGARETYRSSKGGMLGQIVPSAQAADTPGQSGDNGEEDSNGAAAGSIANGDQQDWARILIVVALLLIIAGSFYALSRSIREPAPGSKATVGETETTAAKKSAKKTGTKRRGSTGRKTSGRTSRRTGRS